MDSISFVEKNLRHSAITMSTNRKITRDKHGHREAILKAFKSLLDDFGYAKVTARAIAKRAGVSVGLVYKNFPNGKPDVVRALFLSEVESVIPAVDLDRLNPSDIPDFVQGAIMRLLSTHKADLVLNKALEAAYFENPELQDDFRDLIQERVEFFPRVLARFVAEGWAWVEDPKQTGELLVHLVDAMIHRHLIFNTTGVSDEDLVNFLTEVVLATMHYSPPASEESF